MATWNELLIEFADTGGPARESWFNDQLESTISALSGLRGNTNVVVYASGFLQKPSVPSENVIVMPEDINGFMAALTGMDWDKGLTLVLHTPGGVTMATQAIVDYLRSKFSYLEVIVPVFAMSAGTMMALASDKVIMGNQSQLGPIDPQLQMNGRQQSARAIVEQFDQARTEILSNPMAAHVWAPILASHGPALLQYAQDQLDFSEQMVASWLTRYMMAKSVDADAEGKRIAAYFNNASHHKSHDKRIGFGEAEAQGVIVEKLEADQPLQEVVLTLYHVLTILFEQSAVTKIITSGGGRRWAKQWVGNTP